MDARISETLIPKVMVFHDGRLQPATVRISEGRIEEIIPEEEADPSLMLLPGVIDAHVHFREPGLTTKADISSESRAAAAGGVTYVLDMPNVNPTTTTPEALAQKQALFKEKCVVNYGIWYGITADNIDQALNDYGQPDSLHRDEICGFKVFLGSSTGGMLMNDRKKLKKLFANTQRVIGIHSESEDIIRKNADQYRQLFGEKEVPIEYHPKIRNAQACLETTKLAVDLALETGAQLHVCHLTTQDELDYTTQVLSNSSNPSNSSTPSNPTPPITLEACVAHLWFSQEDYKKKGALIKCNPAIKRIQDRDALRKTLTDGRIFSIATDHAPHLLSDKQGGALRAASGMPSVQYSLLAMLELCRQDILPLSKVVELMSVNPAKRFDLTGRGEIRVGNFADLVLVSSASQTVVSKENILSKCGWSPFEGQTFSHQVLGTWVNGKKVFG